MSRSASRFECGLTRSKRGFGILCSGDDQYGGICVLAEANGAGPLYTLLFVYENMQILDEVVDTVSLRV
jgi:hypothetical protein